MQLKMKKQRLLAMLYFGLAAFASTFPFLFFDKNYFNTISEPFDFILYIIITLPFSIIIAVFSMMLAGFLVGYKILFLTFNCKNFLKIIWIGTLITFVATFSTAFISSLLLSFIHLWDNGIKAIISGSVGTTLFVGSWSFLVFIVPGILWSFLLFIINNYYLRCRTQKK